MFLFELFLVWLLLVLFCFFVVVAIQNCVVCFIFVRNGCSWGCVCVFVCLYEIHSQRFFLECVTNIEYLLRKTISSDGFPFLAFHAIFLGIFCVSRECVITSTFCVFLSECVLLCRLVTNWPNVNVNTSDVLACECVSVFG